MGGIDVATRLRDVAGAVDGRVSTPAILTALSLGVGLFLGFDVFRTGTADLVNIVEVSLLMTDSVSIAGIADVASAPTTSPGRHIPYVLLFVLTRPASLAAAQSQGVVLTWLIAFGFVPVTAYAAGEALQLGYGRYVLIVDVILRLVPWSRYHAAQPQYILAAGFGYLALYCLLSRDIRPVFRGAGIGATAAAATWVTPVAGLLVTAAASFDLLSRHEIRELAAAASTGLLLCVPLLLVAGGTNRALGMFWYTTGIMGLIHPEVDLVWSWVGNSEVLLTGIVGGLAAWLSDRETVQAIGTLTCLSAMLLATDYFGKMALLLFVPLLTVETVARIRAAEWPDDSPSSA